MAYTQNNPLSRKKSPLNHQLRDTRTGSMYPHNHTRGNTGFTGLRGKLIQGNDRFNINARRRFLPDGAEEKTSAYDQNMAFAGDIANIYNQGGFTPGATFSGSTYSNKPNRRADDTFLNKLTGLRTRITTKGSTGVPDDLEIEKIGRNIGARGQEMYNLGEGWNYDDEGGWNFTPAKGQVLTAPEQQYTPEQVYELMSQGNGMVQYVEGIGLVAGNPSEQRYDMNRFENKSETIPNSYIKGSDTVPEGYELVAEEPIVEETVNAPWSRRKTVKELLEARKQQNSSGPSRKSSSPLNNNHGDPRSGGPLEGYEYGEGIVGEKILVTDPVTGEKYWETPTTFSGTMNVPGVKEVPGSYKPGTPGGTPVNPNPNNLPKEELDKRFRNFCLENPTDPKCKGFNEREGIVLPPEEVPTNEVLLDQYVTRVRKPFIEEIEEDTQPMFSIGTSNVGKRTGGKIKMPVPDLTVSLPKIDGGGSKICGCPDYN